MWSLGLERAAIRMMNKMKVTTPETSVGRKAYQFSLHVYFMPCPVSTSQPKKKSHGNTTSDWSQQQSWFGYFESFLLICTVLALICILEKLCTTIQYKTLCQTNSITEKISKIQNL